MIATSREYSRTHPSVRFTWEKRSLQAFADRPIAEMCDEFDLMVIDHPHIGEASELGLLFDFTLLGRDSELAELAANSVGASYRSYEFGGRQLALAIDAATPVAAYRHDLLPNPPSEWNEVISLAASGSVAFALVPINALMTFMGLAKNLGYSVAESKDALIQRGHGLHVLEMMTEIVSLLDPVCLTLDPIGILDLMGDAREGPAYSPFGYGYTNYSRTGYRKFPVTFADAPGCREYGPRGTVLGGTGISVSAASNHIEAAADYAFWIAGAQCQSDLYFRSGGQPGHAAAWECDFCNSETRDFFRNTRRTLETAWLRPRYSGYIGFQDEAGDIIHAFIRGDIKARPALDQLQTAYTSSRKLN